MATITVDSKQLQQTILDLGGSLPKYGVDGKWGKESNDGLAAVCSKYGIYFNSSTRSGSSVVVDPGSAAVLVFGTNDIRKGSEPSIQSQNMPGMVYTMALQQYLNQLGYLPSTINGKNQLDGKFGPNTNGALATASMNLGVPLQGATPFLGLKGVTVSPAALYLKLYQAVIKRNTAKATKPTTVPASKAKAKEQEKVKEAIVPAVIAPTPAPAGTFPRNRDGSHNSADVQTLLNTMGFSPGVIDGRWGKNSRAAMKAATARYGIAYTKDVVPKNLKTVTFVPSNTVDKLFIAYQAEKAKVVTIPKAPKAPKKPKQPKVPKQPEKPKQPKGLTDAEKERIAKAKKAEDEAKAKAASQQKEATDKKQKSNEKKKDKEKKHKHAKNTKSELDKTKNAATQLQNQISKETDPAVKKALRKQLDKLNGKINKLNLALSKAQAEAKVAAEDSQKAESELVKAQAAAQQALVDAAQKTQDTKDLVVNVTGGAGGSGGAGIPGGAPVYVPSAEAEMPTGGAMVPAGGAMAPTGPSTVEPSAGGAPAPAEEKKSNTGLIVAGVAVVGGIALIAMSKKKLGKKKPGVADLFGLEKKW